jgi:hypothetical protein
MSHISNVKEKFTVHSPFENSNNTVIIINRIFFWYHTYPLREMKMIPKLSEIHKILTQIKRAKIKAS